MQLSRCFNEQIKDNCDSEDLIKVADKLGNVGSLFTGTMKCLLVSVQVWAQFLRWWWLVTVACGSWDCPSSQTRLWWIMRARREQITKRFWRPPSTGPGTSRGSSVILLPSSENVWESSAWAKTKRFSKSLWRRSWGDHSFEQKVKSLEDKVSFTF